MNKQELEALLATALTQRTQAYALKAPRVFITAVNHQIRTFRTALAELPA